MVTIKEFTAGKMKAPVEFSIDGDKFRAIPANRLPADFLVHYFEQVGKGNIFDAHIAFFEFVLEEDSYGLFRDRMKSRENPITITVMGQVASWLLGEIYMGGNNEE